MEENSQFWQTKWAAWDPRMCCLLRDLQATDLTQRPWLPQCQSTGSQPSLVRCSWIFIVEIFFVLVVKFLFLQTGIAITSRNRNLCIREEKSWKKKYSGNGQKISLKEHRMKGPNCLFMKTAHCFAIHPESFYLLHFYKLVVLCDQVILLGDIAFWGEQVSR